MSDGDVVDTTIEDPGVPIDSEESTSPADPISGEVGGVPTLLYDLTGDGVLDTAIAQLPSGVVVAAVDDNGDRLPDTLVVDLDDDGVGDLQVVREGEGYLVTTMDADGQPDKQWSVTRDELMEALPGVAAFLDLQFGELDHTVVDPGPETGTESTWSVQDGALIGDPSGAAEHWFQQAQNGFCAPASVAQIVSAYTGKHYESEAAFVQLANQQGVWEVGPDGIPGITAEGTLQLLEASGVPAALVSGANSEMLVDYLDTGHNIILFVDSGEYWEGEATEDNQADHAVVLTGIDAERGVAILSDPGHPDGNALEVPLELLEDAWADSGNTMIVSEQPAQQTVAASAGSTDPQADASGALADPSAAGSSSGRGGAYPDPAFWLTPWVLLPVELEVESLLAARR